MRCIAVLIVCFCGLGFFVFPADVFASSITVSPGQSIQTAIDAANPGDRIIVKPGTYRENIVISNKNGQATLPIRIIGESGDPAHYPVVDGGDAGFTRPANKPAFTMQNSSWILVERLKIMNSSDSAFQLDASHHIVIRRNTVDYHSNGVLTKGNSNHILVEYNDMYQSYPAGATWTQLKSSKWEGGAYRSNGGAGMNVIRYNYFHHQFNSILLSSAYLSGGYRDANTWIYRNRFEDIVDDPYEPETYAFNNHFFHNTLINTHRMVSLAPITGVLLGPIYIYNNLHIISKDPTREAVSLHRTNSTYKLNFTVASFANGAYGFNNSVDVTGPNSNANGAEILSNSSVKNFSHLNHAYRSLKPVVNNPAATLINSVFNYDMSQSSLGIAEANGYPNTDPQFVDTSNEDLRLTSASPARGKSREFGRGQQIAGAWGFSSSPVVSTGADLGAFQFGENDFRTAPSPVYVTPPGGEPAGFGPNTDWPADTEEGVNPSSGPKWLSSTPKLGDANGDNKVDGIDYVVWLNHYNQSVSGASSGDFNNSGKVDGIDYVVWVNNYGK